MTLETLPIVADDWNLRIGTIWAELLSAHGVDRDGLVIEVGPGFADKVGLGLAAHGFGGTFYVVEPNAAAREWVKERYRRLLPEATIVTVADPIPLAVHFLPARVDALLMNHVLDDLVLHAALPPRERERVFRDIRPEQTGPREVWQTWQRLLGDPGSLQSLEAEVIDGLRRLLVHSTPHLFGAAQYESWYLTANGLGEVDRLGAALLWDLSRAVGRTGAEDRALLQRLGQDPDRWLVCDPKSGRWEAS